MTLTFGVPNIKTDVTTIRLPFFFKNKIQKFTCVLVAAPDRNTI